MKTFKQFLKESLSGSVIRTISYTQVDDFTKNSKSKNVRFIIDKNDKLHVGDGNIFIHAQIATDNPEFDGMDNEWVEKVKYAGFISLRDMFFSIAKVTNSGGYKKAGKLEGKAKALEDYLNKKGYDRGADGDWEL